MREVKECPYCGSDSWNKKMFTTICTVCSAMAPYKIENVIEARFEELRPKGVELIRKGVVSHATDA